MAAVTWPATLPQNVLTAGFSHQLANNLASTNFDIGAPQVRQRSTAAPELINGSVLMNQTQLAAFRVFYNSTLLSGSQRFDWTDPASSVAVEMLFDPTNPPKFTNVGGNIYQVTFKVLVFELP